MKETESMVWFACPKCGEHLKSPASIAGEQRPCPLCTESMVIPAQSQVLTVTPVAEPPAELPKKEKGTVPFKIAIPHLGEINTLVSRATAGSLLKTVIGGLMVALGVILGAKFGGRRPSA